MGIGSGPYAKVFPGHTVPMDNSRYAELEPYKSLDASRLKLVGQGHFDAGPFLPPELYMAYVYPDSLLSDRLPKAFELPQKMDSVSEVSALARLWDAKGLLHVHDTDLQSERPHELVRVFNCLKNSAVDRQIGDRRGRNAVEDRVTGPSLNLPSGTDLLDLHVAAQYETLSIICTGRRDFYHQFKTSQNRTLSNTVGPRIPLALLRDTMALEVFAAAQNAKKPPRSVAGDGLGISSRQLFARCPKDECMVSFRSIFQGDHAGVEIATAAHEGLLQSAGLLNDATRVVSSRPFYGGSLCQGLVIDDYFAIAKVPKPLLVPDPAMECLKVSKALYAKYDILGSDDKDICGERKAKIIGASIDASEPCQLRGHTLVAAPAQKRLALSWTSLQVCQLSHTTDALHLCILGGWTSVLMFRRPFMSVLQRSFHLVSLDAFEASSPKLVPLTRPVADELTILSALVPLCVSDVSVDFCTRLFATDASLEKGAIVSCPLEKDTMECLWRSCRSKGGYSKLLSANQSVLSRCLDFEEEDVPKTESIKRPLAYRFDFVEVFAGAATVTSQVAALGFSVCCPIDLSFSRELDLSHVRVLEWLLHLVVNHFVKSMMLEPPCTTFSIMRRPALRSRLEPFGFDISDPQTSMGTTLAQRALQLLYVCWVHGVTGIVEKPWTSLMKHLPSWIAMAEKDHCEIVRCDSCAYGSIHLKSFAFMCVWADTQPITRRCSGDHEHVQVEGAHTKKSATYVPLLAEALAQVMAAGIRRLSKFMEEIDIPKTEGLESQAINDLCLSRTWQVDSAWTFRVSSHINILEMSVVVRLVSKLVKQGKCLRIVVLVDSNVVKCAAAKGRSSSRALSRLLCRLAALSVAGGIYVTFGFVPTRLNISDDPTRGFPLRGSIPGLDLPTWDRSDLFRLLALPRLRRWSSNWARLVLRLLGPSALSLCDHGVYRRCPFPYGLFSLPVPSQSLDHQVLDFDSTLGFPGEGPGFSLVGSCSTHRFLLVVFWGACALPCHGVLFPRNSGDLLRQAQRDIRPPLQEGRPVTKVTNIQRTSFLEQFSKWLLEQGFSLEEMLANHFTAIDEINRQLVRFGRCLYSVGRPYNHYAETINAVASKKPAIRRQLQEAWNLAFAWIRDEPSAHHIAMPWQVLLACLSVCISWGWLDVAGMLALTWGALLRVGEFLQATRGELLLPCDTNYTNSFALLSLREPKTRFTAARHQSAKLDIPDLLHVVHLAFGKLHPSQKLWPKSGQTLRLRFKFVLLELGIGHNVRLNGKSLDLGSLRAGGATWILQQTEDGELTRRRGRWVNQRVMELYIQEVSCFQFLSAIPQKARNKVFALCDFFPDALRGADEFCSANIPWTVWFILWSGQVNRK